jgi:MFS family permease
LLHVAAERIAAIRLSESSLYQLATLAGTVGAAHLSLNLFSGSLSLYLHRSLGFSITATGVVVGIAFVTQVGATLLVGPFVDRWGSSLALRLGPALYLLASLTFLSTQYPGAIIVARILQGVGIALILPAAFTLIPTLVTNRMRGMALGVVGLFQSFALAIGPQLGIWLLSERADLLFAVAALAAVISLGFSFQLKRTLTPPAAGRFFKYRKSWSPILGLTFLTVLYWGVIIAYLPIRVPASQVFSVGWFFTADALGVLACRIPIGLLSDRMPARWLLGLGIIVTAASILMIVAPISLASLVLAGSLSGVGAGLLIAPSLIELQNLSDDSDRGTAMALWSTSFASGIGLGTIAAGPVVEHLSFNATLIATAALCLAALPILVKIKTIRQPTEARQQ